MKSFTNVIFSAYYINYLKSLLKSKRWKEEKITLTDWNGKSKALFIDSITKWCPEKKFRG